MIHFMKRNYKRSSRTWLCHGLLGLLGLIACQIATAQAITLVPSVSRFAGTGLAGYSGEYGAASGVTLNAPSAVAVDSTGTVYITDTNNNCVRRVDSTTSNMTTAAGLISSGGDTCNASQNTSPTSAQGLLSPLGIAVDSADNLYIADTGHNCVRMLPAHSTGTANLTTVAGTCTAANPTATTTSGSATPRPAALVIDSSNRLYVGLSDTPDSVYQVVRHTYGDAATALCLVAGTSSSTVSTACSGYSSLPALNTPTGLAISPQGDLYIADSGNNCIRRQDNGTTTTVVGTCTNDATASSSAAITAPSGLLFTPQGELLFTSASQNQLYRYNFATNSVIRLSGNPDGSSGKYDGTQNGVGSQSIPLNAPGGLAGTSTGSFYLVDTQNAIVRRFTPTNNFADTPVGSTSASQLLIFTINNASVNLSARAGTDYTINSNTCSGALSAAASGSLSKTCAVSVSFLPTLPGQRNAPLTITDSVSGTSIATGLEGIGDSSQPLFTPGQASTVATGLSHEVAAVTNAAGDLYVLSSDGSAAGVEVRKYPYGGGAASVVVAGNTAGLIAPSALAIDSAENLYLADSSTGNVAKIGSDGTVNATYMTGLTAPTALAIDNAETLYVAEGGTKHDVLAYYAGGERVVLGGAGTVTSPNNVTATLAQFQLPSALAISSTGVLYVADATAHLVYVIGTDHVLHIYAGNGSTANTDTSSALGLGIAQPSGLVLDAANDLFVTDATGNIVYVIYSSASATSNVATVLGTGTAGNTGDGALATKATISKPTAITASNDGTLYVLDSGNSSVRSITFPVPTIDFGTVGVGGTVSQTQTAWNRGNEAFDYNTQFVMSNTAFASNASLTTCGPSVSVGETCDFGFDFTPTAEGTQTGTGELHDTVYNSAQTVKFTGVATVPAMTTFNAPAESIVYGQNYTGTLVVTTNNGPTPTGTVTFAVSGTSLCVTSGNITGTVSCTVSNPGLIPGTYPVTATYSGDTNYASDVAHTTLTVTKAPLTVSVANQSKQLGTANPTLTGTVTGAVGTDQVTATYSTTATTTSPVGNYPIVATLAFVPAAAENYYTVSNTPGTLRVYDNTTTTSLSLTSSLNPSTTSQNVTLTATLNPTTAVGTITFAEGSTVYCSNVATTSGVATCALPTTLSVGQHTIQATYTPTSTLYGSSTASIVQTVTAVPSGSLAITVTPAAQYIIGPGSLQFPVTVKSVDGFAGDVQLSCSGLPSDASCSFGNATVTLTSGGTAQTTMTTTTTKADASLKMLELPQQNNTAAPLFAATVLPMGLGSFGAILAAIRRRKRLSQLLVLAVLALGALGISGCGCPTTSLKNYTVTVTAHSVAGGPSDVTANVQVTVAQPGSN